MGVVDMVTVDKFTKIQAAAAMDKLHEGFFITWMNVLRLLQQRQNIADHMLNEADENKYNELEKSYDYCNEQIKLLLAI